MPDAVLSRPASPRGSTRWAIYGILLAVTLAGIRIAEEPDNQSAAQPQRYPTADALPAELTRIPELELERLARRPQRETDADPFNARSWKAFASDEPRRDTPPPPPQAPPLPFTFMGKLVDEGGIVVFLTNGARNWIVRAGDTIEGLYRVEVIGDERMTLTYLALQTPQELAIGEKTTLPEAEARAATSTAEALLPVDSPRASTALPGAVPLLFAAPARVVAGNELIVSVGLPPGGDARHARVVLAFDPKVLAAIGAPSHDTGRVTVQLAGAAASLAQLRFRVIARQPTTTQIGIEEATSTDSRGANLPLATPGGHSVAIVQAGG